MGSIRCLLLIALAASPLALTGACASSEGTKSTGGGTGDPGAPLAPTELTAAPLGAGIHVTWKDNSSDESQFEVERKDANGSFAKVTSVVFDTVIFHDTGVTAGATYTYRARAVGGAGAKSAYTNEATATAPADTGPVDAGTDAPPVNWDGGAVSFEQHMVPLFERSCGTSTSSCHVREQYFATSAKACRGWLALENASIGSVGYGGAVAGMKTNCPDRPLYDRLTQLDAWQEPGTKQMKYVTPNDAANSYLFQKISNGKVGEASPGVASVNMPPNSPLSATDVAMVKKWIETGAPK